MWFGKKEVVDAVKGVGKFIDEQQLTAEETIQYKFKLMEVMHPFKQIQRIIVTWVMLHWVAVAVNCMIAIWVGYVTEDADYNLLARFVEYASLELVWTPTLGVFTLYLTGGLAKFKRS